MWPFRRKERPRPRIKTPLGTFEFGNASWSTVPSGSQIWLSVINEEFDVASIARIERILAEIEIWKEKALEHLKTSEWYDTDKTYNLESLDTSDALFDSFGLTFEVVQEPDWTVTVEFTNGVPTVVWAAD